MIIKGVNTKKRLGQNFILDKNILSKIADAAQINDKDNIVEIGAGLGTLTIELAKRAKRIVTYEVDEDILPNLKNNLLSFKNVFILNEDIMKADLNKVALNYFNNENFKVVANLPYYITSPVIMHLFECKYIKEITLLIQKEVADRICGKPGTKDYGVLTIAVNYRAVPQIIFNLPPTVFIPQPKVESSLVKFEMLEKPSVIVKDERLFFRIVKAAFGQRRKVLSNALKTLGINKDIIDKAIAKCEIKPGTRGESLSIEQFALLTDNIYNLINM
ncbi:MAG: 16S rRNA (adenine(1518)-N(6)/adenine(1519)-N(6))-dimethyltransferase RsmA [Thermoanaerobacteraceae bacterium]